MKLTIVSDNRVLAEQFHMKSGSYSSCQLFFPFILLIIIPFSCTPDRNRHTFCLGDKIASHPDVLTQANNISPLLRKILK